MNAKKFVDLSKKILMPGQSLLLPMLVLALGLHAALLAMPIPSTETIQEAEDKKNPITISQIPTEQPTSAPTSAIAASVNVPAMAPPTATSDPGTPTPDDSEASVSTTNTAGSASTPVTSSPKNTATTTPTPTSSISSGDAAETASSSDPAIADAGATEPSLATEPTPGSSTNSDSNPFANFPHYQPSEADCYGLGFGENCRVVDQGVITPIVAYFKQELAAKDFTITLITDEPTRKVFKVTKENKTLFLNIWQSKNQVSYLLSRVELKQSPETLKTDAGK